MKIRAVALLGMLTLASVTPGAASAATVGLSQADILGFHQTVASGAWITTQIQGTIPGGAKFRTNFGDINDPTGPQTALVSSNPLNIAFNTGDVFSLVLANVNENPWDFDFSLTTSNGTTSIPLFSLVNGASHVFNIALGAAGTITAAVLSVHGNIPVNLNDRTAEYQLSSIPLPGALLLFGSGLAGLGYLGRRKRKQQAVQTA